MIKMIDKKGMLHMLAGKDYEAINKFKDSIHRNHFLESTIPPSVSRYV